MNIEKNRSRSKFTFANINLLGSCNANCYFCLGKDISAELEGKNQLAIHFSEWKNFEHFLGMCQAEGVTKLYMTGQTADGLQYRYLDEIVDHLQGRGFSVGVRTNGFLAARKMPTIRKMKDEIGYSIHSLKSETNALTMGRKDAPDWTHIIPLSGDNVRVAIVLNRYNIDEFYSLCQFIAQFPNVKYIQVRRISTDTRVDFLTPDIKLFEKFYQEFIVQHAANALPNFYGAQRFQLYGKEVVFWRTVETSVNSLNYFTDGTCSDEYFVVEGYLKNK